MSQICSRGVVPTGHDHDSSKAHISTTTRSKTRNKNDQKPCKHTFFWLQTGSQRGTKEAMTNLTKNAHHCNLSNQYSPFIFCQGKDAEFSHYLLYQSHMLSQSAKNKI